jgi:hypothetical protein
VSIRPSALTLVTSLLLAVLFSFPVAAWDDSPHIKHVLLISVDGLHALDVARYVPRTQHARTRPLPVT